MNSLKRNTKSSRPIKVLQFGAGNFIRAYIDWMVDVLNDHTNFNGDVIIVKPTKHGDYKSLRDQDGLFHIRTNGIKNGELVSETHRVNCVQKIIHPYTAWNDFLETSKIESIRFVVSNTTESGIKFNSADQLNENTPAEFPAKLTAWLHARWKHFNGADDKGTIILPLELIEDNGNQLKDCILNYATHWGLPDEFKHWIQHHNTFCNTLVDRIVTGFPKSGIEEVYENLGCEDKLVVDAEPYHLFVIQGPESVKAELPFDKTDLNVVFTDDLKPHREIKVRILNGAHTSMVPMGLINHVETVGEFMKDERLRKWLEDLVIREIIPTLDYPREQLKKYYDDVMDRFQNPFIKHKLRDISLNSISKFKNRVLPTLVAMHKRNVIPGKNTMQAFAALIALYLANSRDEPTKLRDSEEIINFFKQLSGKDTNSLTELEEILNEILSRKDYWGQDLSAINGLTSSLAESFSEIQFDKSNY